MWVEEIFLVAVCNAETALHYLESDAKVEIGPNLASLDTKSQCSTGQALFPYCKRGLTPTSIDARSSSIDTKVTTSSISAVAPRCGNNADNG